MGRKKKEPVAMSCRRCGAVKYVPLWKVSDFCSKACSAAEQRGKPKGPQARVHQSRCGVRVRRNEFAFGEAAGVVRGRERVCTKRAGE